MDPTDESALRNEEGWNLGVTTVLDVLLSRSNVLKSATLLGATPERHSQNREIRGSATPFYQKEQCGSGTHIFEKSENMSDPLFSL